MNKELLECARNEIRRYVGILNHDLSEEKGKEIADNLVGMVDWTNSALMHKGFYFITENYLKKQGLLGSRVNCN